MEQEDYMRRTYEKGEIVFSEGDRGAEAFLIHSGKVHIYKTENGEILDIDTIGAGKIFGEMGILSDSNRMATAQAVEDTVLTCCHRRELTRRVDGLDEDSRDALRFLIVYCQEFIPYDLIENRPDNDETRRMDRNAYYLVQGFRNQEGTAGMDPFMRGLYQVLVGYAERRLPPNFTP